MAPKKKTVIISHSNGEEIEVNILYPKSKNRKGGVISVNELRSRFGEGIMLYRKENEGDGAISMQMTMNDDDPNHPVYTEPPGGWGNNFYHTGEYLQQAPPQSSTEDKIKEIAKQVIAPLEGRIESVEKKLEGRIESVETKLDALIDAFNKQFPQQSAHPSSSAQTVQTTNVVLQNGVPKEDGRINYVTGIIVKREHQALKQSVRPPSRLISNAETFEIFVEGSTAISDKSLFILQWFRQYKTSIMFTLPNGAGKTTLLTMAATFLRHKEQTDLQGIAQNAPNPFSSNEGGFPFKLMEPEHAKFKQENHGKWPLIFVSFDDVRGDDVNELLASFTDAICKCFDENLFLLDWLRKGGMQMKQRHVQLFGKFASRNVSLYESTQGIVRLAEYLGNYFKKQVIVIIDDFDRAIVEASVNENMTVKDVRKVHEYVKTLLKKTLCIKASQLINRVLIAGLYRMELEDTNISHYGWDPNLYSRYFGFDEHEFSALCNCFGVPEELRKAATVNYNGFNVDEIKMYSTRSTVKFFEQFQSAYGGVQNRKRHSIVSLDPATSSLSRMIPHFEETPLAKFFEPIFKKENVAPLIQELVNGQSLPFSYTYFKHFAAADLALLRNQMNSSLAKIDGDGVELFLHFLFASGYLVIADHKRVTHGRAVRAPNEEMRKLLGMKLMAYYKMAYNIDMKLIEAVTDELWLLIDKEQQDNRPNNTFDDCPKLQQALTQLFESLPRFLKMKEFARSSEICMRGNEHLVHFLVDIAAVRMPGWQKWAGDHKINTGKWVPLGAPEQSDSNGKDKHTKPDLSIYCLHTKANIGLTIELKYDQPLLEAINQIGREGYLRVYQQSFDQVGSTSPIKIIALAIAVDHKKRVEVCAVVRKKKSNQSVENFIDSVSNELCTFQMVDNRTNPRQKKS